MMKAALPIYNRLPMKKNGRLTMKVRTFNAVIDFFDKEGLTFTGHRELVGKVMAVSVDPAGLKLVTLLCDLLWKCDGKVKEVFGKCYPPYLKIREYACSKFRRDLTVDKVSMFCT